MPDPSDARARLIDLTPTAREQVTTYRDQLLEQWRRSLTGWPPGDVEQLRRCCTACAGTGEPTRRRSPPAAAHDPGKREHVTDTDGVERLEREVGILLRRSRAMNRESAARIHPELNFEAYSILVRIDDLTQVRPTDLAKFFRIGKPTLSRQVRLLEELELIDRLQDPSDGRAALLTLSASGRVKVQAARAARHTEVAERLGSWGDETLTTFAALTHRLNEALSPED